MENKLNIENTKESILINWDSDCGILQHIMASPKLKGEACNIKGEVFFYQYDLDIPFNGQEKEVFEKGDVVYWRSPKEKSKFGILFMYGKTEYGDGTQIQTSSPGIKIGSIVDFEKISKIKTGAIISLG